VSGADRAITVLRAKNGNVIEELPAGSASGPPPQADQRGLHHHQTDAEADASTDEHRERRDFPDERAVAHLSISMGQSQSGHIFL
jgi:hypothetical protein